MGIGCISEVVDCGGDVSLVGLSNGRIGQLRMSYVDASRGISKTNILVIRVSKSVTYLLI